MRRPFRNPRFGPITRSRSGLGLPGGWGPAACSSCSSRHADDRPTPGLPERLYPTRAQGPADDGEDAGIRDKRQGRHWNPPASKLATTASGGIDKRDPAFDKACHPRNAQGPKVRVR